MKFKMVKVTWEDSAGPTGWLSEEEGKRGGTAICVSVSFLFSKDKDCVKIVQSHGEDDAMVGNLLSIPRKNVKSIKILR